MSDNYSDALVGKLNQSYRFSVTLVSAFLRWAALISGAFQLDSCLWMVHNHSVARGTPNWLHMWEYLLGQYMWIQMLKSSLMPPFSDGQTSLKSFQQARRRPLDRCLHFPVFCTALWISMPTVRMRWVKLLNPHPLKLKHAVLLKVFWVYQKRKKTMSRVAGNPEIWHQLSHVHSDVSMVDSLMLRKAP